MNPHQTPSPTQESPKQPSYSLHQLNRPPTPATTTTTQQQQVVLTQRLSTSTTISTTTPIVLRPTLNQHHPQQQQEQEMHRLRKSNNQILTATNDSSNGHDDDHDDREDNNVNNSLLEVPLPIHIADLFRSYVPEHSHVLGYIDVTSQDSIALTATVSSLVGLNNFGLGSRITTSTISSTNASQPQIAGSSNFSFNPNMSDPKVNNLVSNGEYNFHDVGTQQPPQPPNPPPLPIVVNPTQYSRFSLADIAFASGDVILEPVTITNLYKLQYVNEITIPVKYGRLFYQDIAFVHPKGLSFLAYWKRTGGINTTVNDKDCEYDLAGAISCRFDSRCVYIMTLGVLPPFRGQGLASLLIRHMHRYVKDNGSRMLAYLRACCSEMLLNPTLNALPYIPDETVLLKSSQNSHFDSIAVDKPRIYSKIVSFASSMMRNPFLKRKLSRRSSSSAINLSTNSSRQSLNNPPSPSQEDVFEKEHVDIKFSIDIKHDLLVIVNKFDPERMLKSFVLSLPSEIHCEACGKYGFPFGALRYEYSKRQLNNQKEIHPVIPHECDVVKRLCLHVQITNHKALRFYIRNGFQVLRRVEDYYAANKGIIPPHAYLLSYAV